MQVKIKTTEAYINPCSLTEVEVTLVGPSESSLIAATEDIPLEKIVSEIGIDYLLDAIGKDKCMEYFNLYEEE